MKKLHTSQLHINLKNLVRNFHSFEVLVNFRLHKHWCFYQVTISRKIATQSWRSLSTYETDYHPPDSNPVFYSLGEVLLLLMLSSPLLLLFLFGSKWFSFLWWLKKENAPMACAKYSQIQQVVLLSFTWHNCLEPTEEGKNVRVSSTLKKLHWVEWVH